MMRVFLFLVVLSCGYSACKREEVCLQPQSVSAKAGFYSTDSLENIIDSNLIASRFYFQAQDSIYVYTVANTKAWRFVLSTATDSTRFIFQTDTTTNNPSTIDTITMFASRNPVFVSVACGFQFNFNFQRVTYTRHYIDSIWIVKEEVNDDANAQHLNILLQKK